MLQGVDNLVVSQLVNEVSIRIKPGNYSNDIDQSCRVRSCYQPLLFLRATSCQLVLFDAARVGDPFVFFHVKALCMCLRVG